MIIGLEVGAPQKTSQTSAPLRLVDIHQAEEQGGMRSSETEEKTRGKVKVHKWMAASRSLNTVSSVGM